MWELRGTVTKIIEYSNVSRPRRFMLDAGEDEDFLIEITTGFIPKIKVGDNVVVYGDLTEHTLKAKFRVTIYRRIKKFVKKWD